MKWPLKNCGATYLRDVTDTVQTVQYSDSQCILYTVTILARASTLQLVAYTALVYSTMTFYTVRVFYLNIHRKKLFWAKRYTTPINVNIKKFLRPKNFNPAARPKTAPYFSYLHTWIVAYLHTCIFAYLYLVILSHLHTCILTLLQT